jgi:hypothetical protein
MARTSRAKEGEAAGAAKPKPAVKRTAPPRQAKSSGVKPAPAPSVPEPVEPVPPGRTTAGAPAASAEVGPPPPSEPEPVGARAAASEIAQPVEAADNDAEPATAGTEPVGTEADHAEPVTAAARAQPSPGGDVIRPRPLAAPDLAAMFLAHRTLIEGSLRVRGQMVGFACRQAEHGLAVGRALLASGSLPEALALQAKYLGQAVDDALAQSLELSRLSSNVVRAGLDSLRPR